MCFGVEWIAYLILKIVFIFFILALLQIWVLPYSANVDPRFAKTIQLFIWFLGICFVVWICVELYGCIGSDPSWRQSPRYHG